MAAITMGQLRDRITLQRRSTTPDELGQDTITWVILADHVPARALTLRGREFFAAAQVQQEQTVKFVLRHRSGLDATCRVLWQGRPHDITAVIPLADQPQYLELHTLAGVKDGR